MRELLWEIHRLLVLVLRVDQVRQSIPDGPSWVGIVPSAYLAAVAHWRSQNQHPARIRILRILSASIRGR